jgi:Peptidase family M28
MAIRPLLRRRSRSALAAARLGRLLFVAHALAAVGCGTDELSQAEVARAIDVAALVERDRLVSHVQALVDTREGEEGELPPWGPDAPLLRTMARTYIVSQLRASGLEPVEEVETRDGIESANILLDIPGAERPDELVIVSAHYDCWYLGADDNASGIAVLLEAARILAQAPPPARTIRLLAFDREEEGLLGSRRYAERHRGDRVALVINLDGVGYSDSTPGSQESLPGLVTPSTGDFLAVVGSGGSRTALSQAAALSSQMPDPVFVVGVITPGDSRYPGVGDLLRSDHAWFWVADVPALFFTDTANFRNPHYHEPTDLPDTLDYDFLERVAMLTIGAAAAFAGVP